MVAKLRRLVSVGILIIGLCGLLTYLGKFHRLFELTNHFRLQYWVGSFVALILMIIWRKWKWGAFAALLLILNSIHLYPWTVKSGLAIATSIAGKQLTLVQTNVQYDNNQYERVIAYLKQTNRDIVVVQEVNQEWIDKLNPIKELYPYAHTEARPKGSGIAVYSKLPFEKAETLILTNEERPAIRVQFKVGTQTVNLITFHPLTPISAAKFDGSTKETAAIAEIVNKISAPKILIGDFNDTMFSSRHSSLLAKTGLHNVRSTAGSVIIPTWPSWLYFSWFMIPIDHCLVSSGIWVDSVHTGAANGSDHLPLEVNLILPQ